MRINPEEFQRKAKEIFESKVKPQLEKTKMTPKEEAKNLLDRMTVDMSIDKFQTKECAIVAVNRIIEFGNELGLREPMMHWYKVREELKKI